MKKIIIFSTIFTILLASCQSKMQPKPHGYMRIEFPEKNYATYSGQEPYTFDIPEYCTIEQETMKNAEKYWTNIVFKNMDAKIHLSFKFVNHNIDTLIEDCHSMAYKHVVKADAIQKTAYVDDTAKVYGLLYEIKGNVASPVQFYVTDSIKHFLRGSLYFNSVPNKDSLAPAIEFIKTDIQRIVESTRWKNIVEPKTKKNAAYKK